MPFLLYVLYPCVMWSVWCEQMTGVRPAYIRPKKM